MPDPFPAEEAPTRNSFKILRSIQEEAQRRAEAILDMLRDSPDPPAPRHSQQSFP